MSRAEAHLTWFLRILGIIMMLAVFAVVMPHEHMDMISGRLTGWSLPNTPIVNYLTRGLSVMYVFFGAIVFRLSFEPSKHVDILKFLGEAGLVFAVVMTVLDVAVPTGFAAETESIDRLVKQQSKIKRYDVAGRKVIFYIENMQPGERLQFVFQARALFPVKAQAVTSQAYSYYRPEWKGEALAGALVVR